MTETAARDDTGDIERPLWRRALASPWAHLFAAFVVFGLVLSFIAKPYVVPSGSMDETLVVGDRILVNRLAYTGTDPSPQDVVVFDAEEAWGSATSPSRNPLRVVLRWVGEVTGFGPSGDHTLVKRVVGTPGQTVECCDTRGSISVDGVALDEPYISTDLPFTPGVLDCGTTPRSARCFDSVTVPADSYLVLGDNRANSADSASWCRGDRAVADDGPPDTHATAGVDGCWRWATRSGLVGQAAFIWWPIGRWSGL